MANQAQRKDTRANSTCRCAWTVELLPMACRSGIQSQEIVPNNSNKSHKNRNLVADEWKEGDEKRFYCCDVPYTLSPVFHCVNECARRHQFLNNNVRWKIKTKKNQWYEFVIAIIAHCECIFSTSSLPRWRYSSGMAYRWAKKANSTIRNAFEQ